MRKTYIDNIRWITVLLVVLYHVIFMYNGVETSLVIGPFSPVQYQDAFLYLVYPWFMLLLFVVAGMSSRYYLAGHTDREYVRSRTVKLLVPSTIGLFVFQWVQGYYSMAITGGLESMAQAPFIVRYLVMALSGQGVLWFLQLLWLFSMLLVLIRKIEKDRLYGKCGRAGIVAVLLLTLPVYLSAQVLNTPMIVVFRFGFYGLGFLIGYFLFSQDEVMDRLEKYWLPLTVAALGLAIAFTVVFWGKNYAQHEVLDTPLCNLFAWIAVIAVLSFMKKWGNFENRFSKWMTAKSWGLYVFHYTVLSMVAYYLNRFVPDMPAVLCYGLSCVGAFAGAYLLYEIIRRIPVVNWCVLGVSRRK